MLKSKSLPILAGAAVAAAFLVAAMMQVQAANIIAFGDNPGSCGGSVICSSTTGPLPAGTQGYLINGSGVAFDLSTINSWFQIDPSGTSHLPNQPAEPNGGAGQFLVVNDTGSPVTSFSLTLNTTFTSGTPSVTTCGPGPQAGNICDNFTAQGGSGYHFNTELSGPDWNDCTQGTTVGMSCTGDSGGVAADFAPSSVTYTWTTTPGVSIPVGADFEIRFASWNADAFAPAPLIGHGLFVLLAVGGVLFGGKFLESLKKRRSLETAA
jgi:hypothetical protein